MVLYDFFLQAKTFKLIVLNIENWLKSKSIETSTKPFIGIVYTNNWKPENELPPGVLSIRKWGTNTCAITFFSGYYMRAAILNRLELNGQYLEVFCVAPKSKLKDFSTYDNAMKHNILQQYQDSPATTFSTTERIRSYAEVVRSYVEDSSSSSRTLSQTSSAEEDPSSSSDDPSPTSAPTITSLDPVEFINLLNNVRSEISRITESINSLSFLFKAQQNNTSSESATYNNTSMESATSHPVTPEPITSEVHTTTAETQHTAVPSKTNGKKTSKKSKSSLIDKQPITPIRRSSRLNRDFRTDKASHPNSRHSTSLENSQPSNDAQDGPTVTHFKCTIANCPASAASGWKHSRRLLEHYLEEHYNQMPTISMEYWSDLAILGDALTFCYPCHKIWSSKKKACPNCKSLLTCFAARSSQDNIAYCSEVNAAESPDNVASSRQNSNAFSAQNLQWLHSFPMSSLLELCNSIDLRTDLNDKLHMPFSKALSFCLDFLIQSLDSNDSVQIENAFKILFIFPTCILGKPKRSRSQKSSLNINKLTSSYLQRWMNGDFHSLFTESLDRSKKILPSSAKKTNERANSKRAELLVSLNRLSDAVKALDFRGFNSSEDCAQKLMDKHPPRKSYSPENLDKLVENLPSNIFSNVLTISSDSVLQALKSFPKGTAVGFSGLSPLHLLRCCVTPAFPQIGDNCLNKLTNVFNYFIRGIFPPSASEVFFGANLVALNKKDGGIRPVAIGEILRRTLSKLD
jgi:hypothetical protein